MQTIFKCVIVFLVIQGVVFCQTTKQKKRQRPPAPLPTHANVKYGPYERNVMDVWLAESDEPTPVVVSIHGGAFRHGDKNVNSIVLRECLAAGISVVTITYRFSGTDIAPAQHHDAARAIQFVRYRSDAWSFDPDQIACVGGSAGAGISLWLGFHDDLADSASDDPVLRQSTRLTCMAVNNGQSSYDPRFIRELFPGSDTYRTSALAELFGVDLKKLDELPEEKYKLFEEVSAINHLTKDDVPVLMTYDSDFDTPISSRSIGIHHPRFGQVLKERMDTLGIECTIHTDFDRTKESRSKRVVAFLKKQFHISED